MTLSTKMSRCICSGTAVSGQVGTTMVRSELEREPGGRVAGVDDHEIGTCVSDRVVQECGVEPHERSRVWAVEDDVVQASAVCLRMISADALK